LRVGSEFSNMATSVWNSLNIFGALNKPGVAAIEPTRFSTGYGKEYGIGYIPGAKSEVEAIFIPGSEANLIGKDFYFIYKGRSIPIDTFKMTGQGTVIGGRTEISAISSSYSGLPSSYTSLPYFKISSIVSSRPSYSMAKYSYSGGYSYEKPSYSMPSSVSRAVYSSPVSRGGRSVSSSIASSISSSAISSSISSAISKSYYSPSQSYTSRMLSYQYLPTSTLNYTIPKLGFGGKKKKLKFWSLQPKKYQPSLRAEIFNIKAAKIPKFSFTGISTRPIISRGRK
jgi:hypothetical protein